MSNRISLPQLPGWNDLSDSERWHAGYCARRIEDFNIEIEWRPGCVHQIHYKGLPDTELYLIDSLLCALTHAEPLTALRALLQAARYLGKLEGAKGITGHWNDTYAAARSRVEQLLETP